MPKKLNVRELLQGTPYEDKAEVLAVKIGGWGLDNDRDIYSISEHGKIMGINPNLIIETLISQSLKDPEAPPPGVAAYEEEPDWLISSPAALELAQENDIDLSAVRGSGKGGTIIKKDVEKLINLEEDKHDD